MLFGVNGLHAGNIDRENKEPTIEGLQEVSICLG